MSTSEASQQGGGPTEIGPAPYFHRSDCNICKKQDGIKTGSGLRAWAGP